MNTTAKTFDRKDGMQHWLVEQRAKFMATMQADNPDVHPLLLAFHFADSYGRAGALLHLYDAPKVMPRAEWFQTLGEAWTICDNLGRYAQEFAAILNGASPAERNLMMTEAERAALAAMPDEITVYRGCYDFNRDGLSWSLSRDIAERFATTLHRYAHKDDQPLILAGRIHKDACVLMLGRSEQEIIAQRVQIIDTPELAFERVAA